RFSSRSQEPSPYEHATSASRCRPRVPPPSSRSAPPTPQKSPPYAAAGVIRRPGAAWQTSRRRCPLLAETTAARLHALAGTTARGSGAGAGYQSGREHYRRGVAAFQAGQQEPGQRHGLVGGGGADGGQGRGGVGGGLDVAEAHDGQVVRDAEARFGGGAEGADGEVVGGGEDGVEAAVVGEQPGEGGRAGVGGVLGQRDVREEA